jgi:hypothetical protein
MKLLSFDIGINNLAYCYLDNKQIIAWDVIDLMSIQTCKPELDEACIYHLSKKWDKQELISFLKDKNIDHSGKKEELFEKTQSFLKSKKIKKIEPTNLDLLSFKLFTFLKSKPEFLDAKIICLENQPSLKNPTMKSLQILLYSYFVFEKYSSNLDFSVHLVSATNKSKLFCEAKKKTTYQEKKKLAIEYAKKYVQDSDWESFFDSHKKNDDLADSLIQGLYFYKSIE